MKTDMISPWETIIQDEKVIAFSYSIVLFRYDAGIVTPLSFWYDECRRPKTGHPSGGLATL